jgi:P2 family phage contractile tail tube protein
MANPIPEKVVNYNVYDEGEKLVGIAAEVTLPTLESITETLSGAGIAGEIESPTPGHFGSTTIEIPFRVLQDPSFKLAVPGGRTVTLRAAQQSYDVSGGQLLHRGLKVTIKGLPKSQELGTLSPGKPTESKVTLEVVYLKVEENGATLLEMDKLNFICNIDGVDVLEQIRQLI